MVITFKLSDPRRYLGLVAIGIAAADEVDKKGVLQPSYCILKIFGAAPGKRAKPLSGAKTCDLNSYRDA
jgi:hypothetical protein